MAGKTVTVAQVLDAMEKDATPKVQNRYADARLGATCAFGGAGRVLDVDPSMLLSQFDDIPGVEGLPFFKRNDSWSKAQNDLGSQIVEMNDRLNWRKATIARVVRERLPEDVLTKEVTSIPGFPYKF